MTDEISNLYANDDLSELSRVTLVIPTYNRNFYLSRCLGYHAHFPFAEIIVADSSQQEKRAINKKTIQELSDRYTTKITYLEYDYPAEEYGGEIYRKWGDAVHHVSTEYSLSCTDKEFLIPTTIVKSIKFLDEHPDYSIADGKYYIMYSKRYIRQWQGEKSIIEKTQTERLGNLIYSIIGTQFAVHRTEDYIQIFESLNRYNLYDIRFGETLIETLPLLKGKLHRDSDSVISIRDNTEYYKQSNIINIITNNLEKREGESSYSRYKSYYNYPLDRRNNLLFNFKKCIENNSSVDNNCSFYYKIFNRRYPPQQNLLLRICLGCWIRMPYILTHTLSPYLPKKYSIHYINLDNEASMVKYIFKIILETRQYISTDTPITQTNVIHSKII